MASPMITLQDALPFFGKDDNPLLSVIAQLPPAVIRALGLNIKGTTVTVRSHPRLFEELVCCVTATRSIFTLVDVVDGGAIHDALVRASFKRCRGDFRFCDSPPLVFRSFVEDQFRSSCRDHYTITRVTAVANDSQLQKCESYLSNYNAALAYSGRDLRPVNHGNAETRAAVERLFGENEFRAPLKGGCTNVRHGNVFFVWHCGAPVDDDGLLRPEDFHSVTKNSFGIGAHFAASALHASRYGTANDPNNAEGEHVMTLYAVVVTNARVVTTADYDGRKDGFSELYQQPFEPHRDANIAFVRHYGAKHPVTLDDVPEDVGYQACPPDEADGCEIVVRDATSQLCPLAIVHFKFTPPESVLPSCIDVQCDPCGALSRLCADLDNIHKAAFIDKHLSRVIDTVCRCFASIAQHVRSGNSHLSFAAVAWVERAVRIICTNEECSVFEPTTAADVHKMLSVAASLPKVLLCVVLRVLLRDPVAAQLFCSNARRVETSLATLVSQELGSTPVDASLDTVVLVKELLQKAFTDPQGALSLSKKVQDAMFHWFIGVHMSVVAVPWDTASRRGIIIAAFDAAGVMVAFDVRFAWPLCTLGRLFLHPRCSRTANRQPAAKGERDTSFYERDYRWTTFVENSLRGEYFCEPCGASENSSSELDDCFGR